MPHIQWFPEKAGGFSSFDDISSIHDHEVVTCDNIFPRGRRWVSIEGNTSFVPVAGTGAPRHLVEWQPDDGAGGTQKLLIGIKTDGSLYEISGGTWGTAVGSGLSTATTTLWDSAVVLGVLTLANGVNAIQQVQPYLVDAFTRSDAATLGASWTKFGGLAGNLQVVSNAAQPTASNAEGGAYYSAAGAASGISTYSEITITTLASASYQVGPTTRRTSAANDRQYIAMVTGPLGATATVAIQLGNADGSRTTLASAVTTTVNSGDKVRLTSSGNNTHTATVNGVSVNSVNDTTLTSGESGIRYNAGALPVSNITVDNFQTTSSGVGSLVTLAGSPPLGRYLEWWRNRLFVAGVTGSMMTIYYSGNGDPTVWTGTDTGTEIVTSPVGDYITAMRSVENYLAIFTKRTVTLIVGAHPDNWELRNIYADQGAYSHRAVQRVEGGLIYTNPWGVWFLDPEGRRHELSDRIRPDWQTTVNHTVHNQFHAIYDPQPQRQRYTVFVATTGTALDTAYTYHLASGQWSRMVSFLTGSRSADASCMREDSSNDFQPYFADTATGGTVYKMNQGNSFASATPTSIAATLTSKIFGRDPFHSLTGVTMGGMATKHWSDAFTFNTAQTGGTITYAIRSHQDTSRISQLSFGVSPTSAAGLTADLIRSRIPLNTNGWGVQLFLSQTDTFPWDFIGAVLDYEETGEK